MEKISVYCYKVDYPAYNEYNFVFGNDGEKREGVLIGWLKKESNSISLWVEEDENFCSTIIELMFDCLYDEKSFKIKDLS